MTDQWAAENPTACQGRCKTLKQQLADAQAEADALRGTIRLMGDETDALHTLLQSERSLTSRLKKELASATADGSGIWAEMDRIWASGTAGQPEAGQ